MSDIVFPKLVSSNWKMTRTPFFKTMVQESASGNKYATAALRSGTLWKWTLKNGVLQSACAIRDLQAIETLFVSVYGMFDSFLWPDPEPCSITPGYINYFPCKFLSDSVDFDRLCYKIWECGELSFRQVAPPILIRVDDCCVGGTDGVDNPSEVITSAVLSITTAFTQTTEYGAYAGISSVGYGLLLLAGAGLQYQGNVYPKQTNTYSMTGITSAADLAVFHLYFYIDGSLPGTGDSQFVVYGASMAVTYADGTNKTYQPTTTKTYINNGTIDSPEAAIDGDLNTNAVLTRTQFAPLATPSILQIGSFTSSI